MKKENLEKYMKQKIRFNKRSKLAYAEQLIHDYEPLGYKGMVDTRKVGMKKVHNILIGNFKTAKNIIVVPYDTPKKVLWPNYKFYAQNGDMAMKKNFVPYYMPLIIAYVILLAIVYVLPNMFAIKAQNVIFIIALVYLAFLMQMIFRGFANAHNAVRVDTSIALAYEVAESLSASSRKEVAFVFSDANTLKMQGSEALEQFLHSINRKPNKIILYCIGKGDRISIAYRKEKRKEVLDMIKKHKGTYPVEQRVLDHTACMQLPMDHLDNAMMISSGELLNNELVVKGLCTSKDVSYEEAILDDVKQLLLNYLK
ncbi:MAG: hypothetical protein EOM50_03995 [Erysipelotrichia bacterium]|nr:hypothetical protein [Erysipelotrichia bacterium]NCC54981.1 hypothetical protein [Erysipelotrichia bacterium]